MSGTVYYRSNKLGAELRKVKRKKEKFLDSLYKFNLALEKLEKMAAEKQLKSPALGLEFKPMEQEWVMGV